MFKDLRGFLAQLEDLGELKRVQDPVSVRYDIAAGIRKTSDIEGPALLFANVKEYPGWSVLGGLFAKLLDLPTWRTDSGTQTPQRPERPRARR
jgi:UbiD family decarboxylase